MSTPPTVPHVHDSDRKAAEEQMLLIAQSDQQNRRIHRNLMVEQFALIIARHHAEERAAVEKAIEALSTCTKQKSEGYNGRGMRCWFWKYHFDEVKVNAALTALRTASQSPTEGKT